MIFPAWVDKPRSKAQRATNRLKYILSQLAIGATERNSMRALGEVVGLDHSTLAIYVRRGQFSEKAARKIEAKFGSDVCPATHLTNPLNIGSK